ncbi:MAG: hypothetical protein HZC26_00785 [Candidatus Magasanikbacteria bacterium]|nr:hypothetical protein [Candidatus Magasanikbacteria bacterium]
MEQSRLLSDGKYITLGAILTALVLFNLWNPTSALLSAITFGCYLIFLGQNLGQKIMPDEKKFWQKIFGVMLLIGLQTIILSIVYWFYRIDRQIIAAVIIFLPIGISFLKIPAIGGSASGGKCASPLADLSNDFNWESYAGTKSYLATKLLAIFVIGGQILLIITLWNKRFSDTLVSPWTIIGPRFFVVFVITTIGLLWVLQKSKHTASNLLLIILHATLILSVAVIIFKIGFGFDPFIHRATEKWILEHGSIEPKTPYYLGQYVLIILTHLTTKIPLAIIDKIIVPLVAGLLLPLLTYFSLSRAGFKDKLYPAIALMPLLPLSYFTVTTPNNFAILIAYFIFLLIWREKTCSQSNTFWLGLVLCLTTIAIHPFVGLPTAVIYFASYLFKAGNKTKNVIMAVIYPLILALTLPAAFYLNSLRNGGGFALVNPLSHLTNLLLLFAKPHWVWLDRGNFWWQALYIYRSMIKPLFVVTAIIGLIIIIKKYKNNLPKFVFLSAIGLFVSAFILSTSTKFAEVIMYEQNVYAERVLELMLVLLVPSFVLALREFFIKIKKAGHKQFLAALIFSFLLLISWYFTYPTRDAVAFHTGWSVRQADINTVNFIDNLNQNKKDYIVIANQLLGAAALQEFGFEKYFKTATGEHYFYSIPTGGPLYQYFRKMVYEQPKREWMESAMAIVGVKKAFFVHTNYWAPAAEIRDQAKLEADRWWELENGRVWVYEYKLK